MKDQNAQFAASIPGAYDRYLGPILFQPYAEDLAARLQVPANASVLELACGTGIVTRLLRDRLPTSTKLVATDLNEPMIRHASSKFAEGGNPVALAIMERDPALLPVITKAVADALKKQFGETAVRAPMRALVIKARA